MSPTRGSGRSFMKSQLLKILAVGAVVLFTSQNMFAQNKQNRNILSIGIGLGLSDWKMRYIISAGREFQLGYGFSLVTLAEYAEYPKYQLTGNTYVISNEPSYSFSLTGRLKISPPWRVSPYFSCGAELRKVYEGETVTAGTIPTPYRTPAHWHNNTYLSLSLGVDIFHTDTISTFFELSSPLVFRGGVGFVL